MRDTFDDLDRKIVALLQQNGRTPNLEMARQLGVAEATVRKRMERLLEDGAIRVVAVVDAARFGYALQTIIGLQVESHRIQEVARKLASLPVVREVSVTAGTFDIIVQAAFASNEALYTFLTEQVTRIGVCDGPRRSTC